MPFCIAVYDVHCSRVSKVLRVLREYLTWTQNSVLEGELTKKQIELMLRDVRRRLDPEYDRFCLYIINEETWVHRKIIGPVTREGTIL